MFFSMHTQRNAIMHSQTFHCYWLDVNLNKYPNKMMQRLHPNDNHALNLL